MKGKVLYFPYIRVPQSDWFTRILLYWDRVEIIVPVDFFENPEDLGEYTRDLVERQLIHQVPPGAYIWSIPNFSSSFEQHLDSLGPALDVRRNNFSKGRTFPIHIEKMEPIAKVMKDIGLATINRYEYQYFNVELETGKEFMAYLATCLAQLPDIQADPVTDEEANLEVFIDPEIDALRIEVLENIFPSPRRTIKGFEIENFKRRHHNKLRGFRRAVERELITIAELTPTNRKRRIELIKDEIKDLVDEIQSDFIESGWGGELVFGKLFAVMGRLPGAPYGFGLASAIFKALEKKEEKPPVSPLAYAAHAQIELLSENK